MVLCNQQKRKMVSDSACAIVHALFQNVSVQSDFFDIIQKKNCNKLFLITCVITYTILSEGITIHAHSVSRAHCLVLQIQLT